MASIPRPSTQREMIDQLWYAIIGSNGDGLASIVRDTRDRVEQIEATLPTLWSRADHDAAEKAYKAAEEKKDEVATSCNDRRKLSRRDWTIIVFTALSALAAVAAVVVAIVALRPAP